MKILNSIFFGIGLAINLPLLSLLILLLIIRVNEYINGPYRPGENPIVIWSINWGLIIVTLLAIVGMTIGAYVGYRL